MSDLNVQFGCGFRIGPSWLNFDVSPSLRLSKIPGLKALLHLPDWPEAARYGNIVTGLPLRSGSCRRLFCDQVIEHLSQQDAFAALKECRRLLATDGVFRLFVPDLRAIAIRYLQMEDSTSADWFLETAGLGSFVRARTFSQYLREWKGNSRHLWAWDVASMSKALQDAGFKAPRQVKYRDSVDLAFDELERDSNWELALGMEAHG